jgi:hypothetical protein
LKNYTPIENLIEMAGFLDTSDLPKIDCEDIETLNKSVTHNEIKIVRKERKAQDFGLKSTMSNISIATPDSISFICRLLIVLYSTFGHG